MATQKHMKASDTFGETQPFFGHRAAFREAFPTIEHVEAKVRGSGVCWGGQSIGVVYTEESLGEYVDCQNSQCFNGGFSIGRILRDMVGAKETRRKESLTCQGHEGSPKGRRIHRRCLRSFEVEIHIEYRGGPVKE